MQKVAFHLLHKSCEHEGTVDRIMELAAIMVANEFEGHSDLRLAGHPSDWLSGGSFSVEEISFLAGLNERANTAQPACPLPVPA